MKREYQYPYIMVDPDGIVQNIAMFDNYENANQITRIVYGEGSRAEAYRYGVSPGDKLIDNVFYIVNEDGSTEPAPYIPNDEDNINDLKVTTKNQQESIDIITDDNAELLYEVSLMQLGIYE